MRNLLLLVLLLFVSGCTNTEELEVGKEADAVVSAVFNFKSSTPEVAGRALTDDQERQLNDINIYLVQGTQVYHQYTTNPKVLMTVTPGNYTVYTIGNMGRDMGDQTKESLDLFSTATYDPTTKGSIIMSNKKEITISSSQAMDIVLQRDVAKILLNLSVDYSVTIKPLYFQIINIPKTTAIFNDITSSTNQADYYAGDRIEITGYTYNNTIYLPENRQGTQPNITDQKDKNPQNAPECATYLYIYATNNDNPSQQIEYYIYLGENNTSDFNVRRNTTYTLNATIKGVNNIDTRVTTTSIVNNISATYMYPTQELSGEIAVASVNDYNKTFQCKIDVISGTQSALKFTVNGAAYTQGDLFNVTTSSIPYTMSYSPTTLTLANNEVSYIISCMDEKGNTKEEIFTIPCYYKITCVSLPEESGNIILSDYVHRINNDYYIAPTNEVDPELQFSIATNTGYRFRDWIVDGNVVSTSNTISCKMASTNQIVANHRIVHNITLETYDNMPGAGSTIDRDKYVIKATSDKPIYDVGLSMYYYMSVQRYDVESKSPIGFPTSQGGLVAIAQGKMSGIGMFYRLMHYNSSINMVFTLSDRTPMFMCKVQNQTYPTTSNYGDMYLETDNAIYIINDLVYNELNIPNFYEDPNWNR